MDKQLKEKLLIKDKWIRCILMLLFVLIQYIVTYLIWVIAIFQFIYDLLSDQPNSKLIEFSRRLNIYLLQVNNFLTFNSNSKPFPFADWPTN